MAQDQRPCRAGQARDWQRGGTVPIPGKTMPKPIEIERDCTQIGARMRAVGPLLDKLGTTTKGITVHVSKELGCLRHRNGVIEEGPCKGRPSIATADRMCERSSALPSLCPSCLDAWPLPLAAAGAARPRGAVTWRLSAMPVLRQGRRSPTWRRRRRDLWPFPGRREQRSLGTEVMLMNAHVFYESMYGSTHSVAEEISHGLQGAGAGRVTCLPLHAAVRAAPDASLVVVGVPSRRGLTDEAALGRLLSRLFPAIGQVPAAAFGTRVRGCDAPAAAFLVAAQLQGHGCRLLVPPEDFLLDDGIGPLHAGERRRARSWGAALAAAAHLDDGPRPAARGGTQGAPDRRCVVSSSS